MSTRMRSTELKYPNARIWRVFRVPVMEARPVHRAVRAGPAFVHQGAYHEARPNSVAAPVFLIFVYFFQDGRATM